MWWLDRFARHYVVSIIMTYTYTPRIQLPFGVFRCDDVNAKNGTFHCLCTLTFEMSSTCSTSKTTKKQKKKKHNKYVSICSAIISCTTLTIWKFEYLFSDRRTFPSHSIERASLMCMRNYSHFFGFCFFHSPFFSFISNNNNLTVLFLTVWKTKHTANDFTLNDE